MKKSVSDLQDAINNIDADARKEPTPEALFFVEIVTSKLFDLNAPSEVADLLGDNVTRLHTDYDADSQLDMEALNNKVAQIAELASMTLDDDGLPDTTRTKIMRIMSSKV